MPSYIAHSTTSAAGLISARTTTVSQGASVEIQTYLGTNGENQLIADITETNS